MSNTESFVKIAGKVFNLSAAFHQFFNLSEVFVSSKDKTMESQFGQIDVVGATHMSSAGLDKIVDMVKSSFNGDEAVKNIEEIPAAFREVLDPKMVDFHVHHLPALIKIWKRIHADLINRAVHFDALVFQSIEGRGRKRKFVLPTEYRFKLHVNDRFVGFNFHPETNLVDMIDESETVRQSFPPEKFGEVMKEMREEAAQFDAVIDAI